MYFCLFRESLFSISVESSSWITNVWPKTSNFGVKSGYRLLCKLMTCCLTLPGQWSSVSISVSTSSKFFYSNFDFPTVLHNLFSTRPAIFSNYSPHQSTRLRLNFHLTSLWRIPNLLIFLVHVKTARLVFALFECIALRNRLPVIISSMLLWTHL